LRIVGRNINLPEQIKDEVFVNHRKFWANTPGMRMLCGLNHVQEPLRQRVRDDNIKGAYTVDMLDVEMLLQEYVEAFSGRPVMDVDTFLTIGFASVIPWVEAICGCEIRALGRGASMVAEPAPIEQKDLLAHMRDLLENIEDNPWYKKLKTAYTGLEKALGADYPITHTLMRGPGDTAGAILGHEKFVFMMLKPDENEGFLHELLELCTQVYLKATKMQLECGGQFHGGYCNQYGIWAPGLHGRTQEDEAAFVSPTLSKKYLLKYHIEEADAFEYSVHHMHSGYVKNVYNWRELPGTSKLKSFQVQIDPAGPSIDDLFPTLMEINSLLPMVLETTTDEHAKIVEEKYMDKLPGCVLHHKINSASFLQGKSIDK